MPAAVQDRSRRGSRSPAVASIRAAAQSVAVQPTTATVLTVPPKWEDTHRQEALLERLDGAAG